MKRNILKYILLLFAVYANAQQERVFIQELSVEPGGDVDYITVAFENAAYDDYTGFQFDLLLPPGLELAYDEGYIDSDNGAKGYLCRKHNLDIAVRDEYVRFICYSGDNSTFSKKSGNLIDIGVVPTAYLKPGDVEIKLKNVKFARKTVEYGFKADELSLLGLTAESTSSITLSVSASNKYSTAVLPFDVAVIPTGLKVYSCNSTDGENLVLSQQSSIKAYSPYILYAPNGFAATLSGTVDASKYRENVNDGFLSGTVVPTEISGGNGCYVMQNKGDGVMFYKVTDTAFSIPAGKCWLTLPSELLGSAQFRFGGTTGIDEITEQRAENESVYDLQGRKVDNPVNGIYIIDGNKILVK